MALHDPITDLQNKRDVCTILVDLKLSTKSQKAKKKNEKKKITITTTINPNPNFNSWFFNETKKTNKKSCKNAKSWSVRPEEQGFQFVFYLFVCFHRLSLFYFSGYCNHICPFKCWQYKRSQH